MNPAIDAFVIERGIREVLHFTTNHGLLGVLASGRLLSRAQLHEESLLDSVKLLNCNIRRDPAWIDYINMSISSVNNDFLGASQGWHPPRDGVWWAVISFDASILSDEGVVFATTNNVYEKTVQRGKGVEGLRALYEDEIPYGYFGSLWSRSAGTPEHQPTHHQAEVLYPKELSTDRARAIYVPEGSHVDEIEGWRATMPEAFQVPIEVRPEVFR